MHSSANAEETREVNEPTKIVSLEVENVKRVKAISLTPSASGLTVLGGDNRQGKTSVLDAICGALGGDKWKPADPVRDGEKKGTVLISTNTGLTVERRYTENGSYLKVNGQKGGQALLNEFVNELALDIGGFLRLNDKARATELLRIIGLEDEIRILDDKHAELYQERLLIGRDAEVQAKHAEAMPFTDGLPAKPLTGAELVKAIQAKLAKNGENDKIRMQVDEFRNAYHEAELSVKSSIDQIAQLNEQLAFHQANLVKAEATQSQLQADLERAQQAAKELVDEDVSDLETQMAEIDQKNALIRQNCEKERAQEKAAACKAEWDQKSVELSEIDKQKADMLEAAELPHPGLSVADGVLTYEDRPWSCLSHAEQLRIATAIVRRLNPNCGFVLVDKLEAMDCATLAEYAAWLLTEDIQVLGTRVSKGDECSIIIEDGQVVAENKTVRYSPDIF